MTITGAPRVQPHTQTQLAITIDGEPLGIEDQRNLLEVRVDLGVSTIGQARLTFADRRGDSDLTPRLLAVKRSVEISSVEPSAVVMSGFISAVEMAADRSGTTVTAIVQDEAQRLVRSHSPVAFENMSYSDVLKTLVSDHGLTAKITAIPGELPWLLQGDTVLGLVDELAHRFGLDWGVHQSTFALWPISSNAPWTKERTLTLATELLTFAIRQDKYRPDTITVRGWDLQARSPSEATAEVVSARDGFAPPAAAKRSVFDGPPTDALTSNQVPATSEEVDALALGLAARAGSVSGRGRAMFDPELRPGGEVMIRGAGSADGRYYVREVTHQVDAGSLRTSFVVGDRPPVQLSDPWRTPPPVSSLRRHGVVVGLVDNVEDPDGWGRVRVSLEGLAEQLSSAWARVLSLGAGDGHGLVVLPEVGDEVLVAFEDDDVRRPVVLGGLYGAKVPMAGGNPAKGSRLESRHLMSRKGHRITVADAPQEFVQLALAGDRKRVRLGKDGTEIAADETPLTISSGEASIAFDGRGNITISAQNLTISAKQSVKVEGIDIVERATKSYEASSINTTLNSSGKTVVKGGTVEISGANVKIN